MGGNDKRWRERYHGCMQCVASYFKLMVCLDTYLFFFLLSFFSYQEVSQYLKIQLSGIFSLNPPPGPNIARTGLPLLGAAKEKRVKK